MAKTINLGKVGVTLGGDYDSSKNYASRTCVFYNHVSWTSKKDVPAGIAPGTNDEYWQKVSERGAQGIQGERGPQGNSAFDGTGIELVNNLTQGGEAAALSAEQGKILKSELTELESEVNLNVYTKLKKWNAFFKELYLDKDLVGENIKLYVVRKNYENDWDIYFVDNSNNVVASYLGDKEENGMLILRQNDKEVGYAIVDWGELQDGFAQVVDIPILESVYLMPLSYLNYLNQLTTYSKISELDNSFKELEGLKQKVVYNDEQLLTYELVENDMYATYSTSVITTKVTGCNVVKYDLENLRGQKIYISSKRFGTYPIFYLIADDTNLLLDEYSETTNVQIENKEIEIAENAKWLYINTSNVDEVKVIGFVTSLISEDFPFVKEIAEKSNHLLQGFSKIENVYLSERKNKYATVSGGKIFIDKSSGSNVSKYDVSQFAGTEIYITTTRYSTNNIFYLFADSADGIISFYQNSDLNIDRMKVSVPFGAKWLYVNSYSIVDNAVVEILKEQSVSPIKDDLQNLIFYNALVGVGKYKGKKCACFGDSITWYDGHKYENGKELNSVAKGYESYLREIGMIVDNYGESGAPLNLILSNIKQTDLSQYDYVTITSGANDTRFLREVGEIQPIGSDFLNTFIGNLQEAVEYILSQNSEVRILLITPIKGWVYYPDGFDVSVRDKATEDVMVDAKYAQAIKAVGALYGLPVCDWYDNIPVNIYTRSWFMNDLEPDKTTAANPNPLYSLHPSTKGYQLMASMLIDKFLSL